MTELSQKVLQLATQYLGPESKRFLERQAEHMDGVSFETMEQQHLKMFAWWCGVSGKLIMNKEKALELSNKLLELLN